MYTPPLLGTPPLAVTLLILPTAPLRQSYSLKIADVQYADSADAMDFLNVDMRYYRDARTKIQVDILFNNVITNDNLKT